ncbi:hypothetical protein GW17_00041507 [Ensete ventricosum]|nr:hypothetical protein GW17_00041507 [Ensete ventricosum]
MHCIIGCRAISIRSRDQKRSCRDKARITPDMLIYGRTTLCRLLGHDKSSNNILALEGGPDIAGTLSTQQLREDVPSVMQETSGITPQPSPPLPLFCDGSPPFHTPGQYWRLFNVPELALPSLNPRGPTVTPEAFQGAHQPSSGHSRNALSYHSLHPVARPTAKLATLSGSPDPDRDNSTAKKLTPDNTTSRGTPSALGGT